MNDEQVGVELEPCPGSHGHPAETVLLDTIPGVEPRGTCPVCSRNFFLRRYRVPLHEVKR